MRDAMVNDSSNEPDDTINNSLPTAEQFNARVPSGLGLDGNLAGTKANFKALNFTGLDNQFGPNDATITFNTQFSFDYDNSNGVDSGKVDFETVAAHEIGHALGFVSVVDSVDNTLHNNTTDSISPRTMDLYRFRNDPDRTPAVDPETAAEFPSAPRSLTPATEDITDFILDAVNEHKMSTGVTQGDGRQASHWKDNNLLGDTGTQTDNLIGMLDPTLANGQVFPISEADWRVFDLIGYEITVPEPGTAALTLFATAAFLLPRRRRERQAH